MSPDVALTSPSQNSTCGTNQSGMATPAPASKARALSKAAIGAAGGPGSKLVV